MYKNYILAYTPSITTTHTLTHAYHGCQLALEAVEEVEEELQGGAVQEHGAPGGWDLHGG